MAILSTGFRPRPIPSAHVEANDAPRHLVEDIAMADASESSSSDDGSGSEDAPAGRVLKQAHRPTASVFSRRFFPSFGFFSRQTAAPSPPISAGKSRKRRNSASEDELPSTKRAFRQ